MKSYALIGLCALVTGLMAAGCSETKNRTADRKVIYHGWSTRDTAYVAEHWAEMEQLPFDGTGIGVALDRGRPTIGDGSTGNLLGWQAFGVKAFELDRFQQAIADLRTPAWRQFTDNFLPVAIATRDQDQGLSWFDDARWATIENNWRVLVLIAREGRCRGLLVDPEHYDYECELFNYSHHRAQRLDRGFAEYEAEARKRGRQLGAAARELFPEITVGLLYGYQPLAPKKNADSAARQAARYALLPAFLDGLIEASVPQAKFVDLWESGHGYKDRTEFLRARDEIRNAGRTASAIPEIYASAMEAGMSLRIDQARDGIPWRAASPDRNHFSPQAFAAALSGALDATDRYVWIYSEEDPRFFPPANLPTEYLDALRAARRKTPQLSSARLLPLCAGLAAALTVGLCIPALRAPRRIARRPDASKRILMVTGIFPPDRGGPASYVPKVASALVHNGNSVEVICLSDSIERQVDEDSFAVQRIRRAQFWPSRILATTFSVWRAARRNDVVYINGLGFESAIGALLAGRPTVHKIVGDYAWERAVGRGWFAGTIDEYQQARKGLRLRLADFIRTFPLRRADHIIVPSQYLRRIVSGWGISDARIRVIPNAVVPHRAFEGAPTLAPWSGQTLITVCRLVPWKGVDALIRLLPELPMTRLVIAGDGHLRGELAVLAKSLRVASRVVFLGSVPQGAVGSYLAQADAFVLNSTYEGLPHVVLEAFAAGTPVIATDAGGTSEVVQHNSTGLLIPIGDSQALKSAIERLWQKPELGIELAEAATARLQEHFDFGQMIASTEETLSAAARKRMVRGKAEAIS